MDGNLYDNNFTNSTQRGVKEEEMWLAVTNMLEELFQVASDTANNHKYEQSFWNGEASCAKRSQILISVREVIDELFIKASGYPDGSITSEHSPTFKDSTEAGEFVDKKRSEISRQYQPSSSAAVPRDIGDIQEIIQEHSLCVSDITDGQIPSQNWVIRNDKPCIGLQATESQHHPNYNTPKIRRDLPTNSLKCLKDPVDSDKINQAATDKEQATKDNNVLQRSKFPKHCPFLSLRDERFETPLCKKPKLDKLPFGSNTDFELNLSNNFQMLSTQTEGNSSECNEKITVCLADITPPQVNTQASSDQDLLVSVENKTHTSLSESVDATPNQTLLTGDDTRPLKPTLQGCYCDNKDEINSNHEDGRQEHLKTSLLKKITNDDVRQYLHLLQKREVVKLPPGKRPTMRNSGVEFDVSSFHMDDIISSKQSDKKCECDVTDEVREHQEKITHDDVGQYLEPLKKPHEIKVPSGKCHVLEDEDVQIHVLSSRQAIISPEQQTEDTCDVTDNQEKHFEEVNRGNGLKATESHDIIQAINAHIGEDTRGNDTDVTNTQPFNDQLVPSFQGEESSCYHGDNELYANDEELKDVKRRRLCIETEEIAPQTSPDLGELRDQQLTSEGAGLVPEYSNADRSNVGSDSVSSHAAPSVVQVVPQTNCTGMFHWRHDITFQNQLPKPSDGTKFNYPQGPTVSQQRPPPLPPCNRKRRVGLSRRQRLSHLHNVSFPPCHQIQMDPTKKNEE